MISTKTPGLQRLIDILQAVDNSDTSTCGFDMKQTSYSKHLSKHPCGTACCIGGHAAISGGDPKIAPETAVEIMLGVSGYVAYEICYPDYDLECESGWDATPAQAIAMLKHFGETGVVDWNLAMVAA